MSLDKLFFVIGKVHAGASGRVRFRSCVVFNCLIAVMNYPSLNLDIMVGMLSIQSVGMLVIRRFKNPRANDQR